MMRADLEYHGDSKTNNHVLNNARALILFGTFIGSAKFYEPGCWLFERELARRGDPVCSAGSINTLPVGCRSMGCRGWLRLPRQGSRRFLLQPILEKMLDVCQQ